MTGNIEETNPAVRPLHNFTLLSHLKWGNHKHPRCQKLNNNSPADHPHRSEESEGSPFASAAADGGDMEAVRHQLMTDFREAADRMKQNILVHTGEKETADVVNNNGGDKKSPDPATRPWTLRSSRAFDGSSPEPWKTKFSIALSKEEIKADFIAMTGAKPPRKPKKRPKAIQGEIDGFFPGFSLPEITPDKYRVPDNADQKKKT